MSENNTEELKTIDIRNIEDAIKNPKEEIPLCEEQEQEKEQEPINIKEEAKSMKMTKKDYIIHKLMEMSTIMGVNIESKRELGRVKVNILQERLNRLLNRGMQRIVYKIDDPTITKIDEQSIKKQIKNEKSQISDDLAVEGLLNIHLTCSDYLEVGSIAMQKYTDSPYVPKLQGLTRNMLDNEDKLRMCLKGLLQSEHGEEIKKYINPVWLYFIFMGGLVTKTVGTNIKNELEEKSQNT